MVQRRDTSALRAETYKVNTGGSIPSMPTRFHPMDQKQVIDIIATYQRLFDDVPLVCHSSERYPMSKEVSEHCAWMLSQMKQMAENGETDKLDRWLGFVQGLLWSYHFYSIDEMQEHNRSKTSDRGIEQEYKSMDQLAAESGERFLKVFGPWDENNLDKR